MRFAFETAGDIRSVDLLAAFVTLWRDRGSGTIRFSRPGAAAGFDLAAGEVTSSFSSQSRFDTADILIRAGKLDPAAVARMELPEGSDAAITALQAGALPARDWKWGQKIRTIEILSDLLGWLEGKYEYDRQARAASGDWTLSIPRLLLELFLRSRDRTLVEHYLGPSDLPLLRAEGFDEAFETFGLTADARSVVRLIDGRATAEEIAARAPADEFAVLKLLAALTTLGLVHPAEAAAPGPTPAEAVSRKQRRERSRVPTPAPAPERTPEPESTPRPEIEPETPAPLGRAEPDKPVQEPSEVPVEPPAEPMPPASPEPEPPEKAGQPSRELPVLPFEPAGTPADLVPEPFGATSGRDESERAAAPRFQPRPPPPPQFATPPSAAGRRGSGALLGGLLAALVIAIAVLVIVRSRGHGGGPGKPPAAPVAQPTAEENPVFPPIETAVPLPPRGRAVATRSPAPSIPPAAAPVRTATAPRPAHSPTSAPTRPPTAVPTTPAPSKTSTPTPTPPPPSPTKTPTPSATRPAPTRTLTPTATATRPMPTRSPTAVPTRPAPTRRPAAAPTLVVPTKRPPTPVPTRPAPARAPSPAPQPSPPAAGGTGGTSRADWLRRAERDRQLLSKRRDVRYAVQLELACELETLEKAWKWDKPAGTMWLLTTSYRGQTCFRVLWGRYATLAQAKAAKERVPGFFTAPGSRPAVVSVAPR